MSTRAGTDCVGHAVRLLTDASPTASLLSVDGVGAFDYVSRAGMLDKLLSLHSARSILPFVRLSYSQPSSYLWTDEDGADHLVQQGEGGEQGDPLMPLLFSLGIHDALLRIHRHLLEGEYLFAYLDDVYAVVQPDRVKPVYKLLEEALFEVAGIRLSEGKTRTWNRAGERPPDMEFLGSDTWDAGGVKVLGAPIGSDAFVAQFLEDRLDDEKRLWDAIPSVGDLQCSRQLLLQCAGPRANHILRTSTTATIR